MTRGSSWQWKIPTLARVVNGWSMNTDTMGVYGNYYLKRAIVCADSASAPTCPRTRSIRLNLGDDSGKPLDGADTYTIHFDKDAIPPVHGLLVDHPLRRARASVANALNRFAVSSWMPLNTTPTDRSISISRTKIRAKTRKRTGCPRQRVRSI